MKEIDPVSERKRWLQELVQAGEAGMLVSSQRDFVSGEVVRFRTQIASLGPAKQVEKKFAVTFDRRYWKQGMFVYPMHVFLDPEHRFSAEQAGQVAALKVGETIDLADGRIVQRQQ